jgi:hypothetical protein
MEKLNDNEELRPASSHGIGPCFCLNLQNSNGVPPPIFRPGGASLFSSWCLTVLQRIPRQLYLKAKSSVKRCHVKVSRVTCHRRLRN